MAKYFVTIPLFRFFHVIISEDSANGNYNVLIVLLHKFSFIFIYSQNLFLVHEICKFLIKKLGTKIKKTNRKLLADTVFINKYINCINSYF